LSFEREEASNQIKMNRAIAFSAGPDPEPVVDAPQSERVGTQSHIVNNLRIG
jgi:hypothetical protein